MYHKPQKTKRWAEDYCNFRRKVTAQFQKKNGACTPFTEPDWFNLATKGPAQIITVSRHKIRNMTKIMKSCCKFLNLNAACLYLNSILLFSCENIRFGLKFQWWAYSGRNYIKILEWFSPKFGKSEKNRDFVDKLVQYNHCELPEALTCQILQKNR